MARERRGILSRIQSPETHKRQYTMFDITEEKRDKFYFEERPLPPHINFEDGDDSEQLLERGAITFYAQGRTLEPLKTSQGIAFINTRYLKPFSDIDAGYELYERTTAQGKPYIAVKSGFMLLGIISPYDLVNETFINNLDEILKLSRIALFNK